MNQFDLSNDYDKYLAYLQSEKWAKLRDQALERDSYHCVICGNPYNIEVHHLRYPDILGTESVSDLQTLCRECHKNIEEYKKGHKIQRKYREWIAPAPSELWIRLDSYEWKQRAVEIVDLCHKERKYGDYSVLIYLHDTERILSAGYTRYLNEIQQKFSETAVKEG